jgi:Flp pilus assembly protein TadD
VAVEHGRLACERAPDSEEAHVALAKILRDAGRPGEGAKMLADFAEKRSVGVKVWAWVGLLQDDAGDYKVGEAAHRKAVALEPGRDDLHNNLGYCLLLQGKKKEAEEEFRTAVRLNGQSAIAKNNLGIALAGGTPKEAVAALQSTADPATAHSNMSAALIEAGKYEDARREIQIALGYNRQHPAALSNLQLVSQLDGKPVEFKVPAPNPSFGNSGPWARMVHVWHRIAGDRKPEDRTNTIDTGNAVASR